MNELMTLDEAFRQRLALKEAGKTIYLRWYSSEEYAVSFAPEQPHPNRYRIILAREQQGTGQLVTLPADTPVYVK
jgi:hypothetical protein